MSHPDDAPAPTGPTTVQQDLLAAALAGLMPLGDGLLVLIGYVWLDIFGAILGIAGAVAWAVWWRNRRGSFFPKDLTGGSVGGIAALVGLLVVVFALTL